MFVHLVNIYCPNADTSSFFHSLDELIDENPIDYLIICGDFKLVLNKKIDNHNYVNMKNPNPRQVLLEMMNSCNLIDFFRHFHPDIRRYTWRHKNLIKGYYNVI